MKQNIQIETKFNFAVTRLFTQKMSMKKDETHTTVIRPELNINMIIMKRK